MNGLAAKRPQPGPVFGVGRPGPFPPGHPAAGTLVPGAAYGVPGTDPELGTGSAA
jgi:hypothetical protein